MGTYAANGRRNEFGSPIHADTLGRKAALPIPVPGWQPLTHPELGTCFWPRWKSLSERVHQEEEGSSMLVKLKPQRFGKLRREAYCCVFRTLANISKLVWLGLGFCFQCLCLYSRYCRKRVIWKYLYSRSTAVEHTASVPKNKTMFN